MVINLCMKFSVCGKEKDLEEGMFRHSFFLMVFYISFCFREEVSVQAF